MCALPSAFHLLLGAQLKNKMLYAATKDFFKSQLDGISMELQATDVDDVGEAAMRDHVASVLTRS
jgi:cofilin